jgi:Cu(I)/Ag(I) efflux system protein CusF
MKVVFLAAVAALAIQVGPAIAQSGDMKDPHAQHMAADKKAQPATYKASGVVKKIDAAKGRVTLAHGAVPELKWPAMTMVFTVKDKALLDKFAVDKKIDFEFVEQGKSYVVTAVK